MGYKHGLLAACKRLGLFHLARFFTARGLRIVCYHGLVPDFLRGFREDIFIDVHSFEARLRFLADAGFHVLDLQEALDRIQRGNLPRLPVVLTFDDGYASFMSAALPLLQRFGYPATVYLNTRECLDASPVFRLVVQFLFWKTERRQIALAAAGNGEATMPLVTPADRMAAARVVLERDVSGGDAAQRATLIAELAERLGVDCEPVFKNRVLDLMRPQEVAAAASLPGVGIHLHTHNHQFPVDAAVAQSEVAVNRSHIQQITGKATEHFCYPYGAWDKRHWPLLAEQDVRSAVTCDAGLNYADTPPLALKRFVDGSAVSQLEFEAHLSGFMELPRRIHETTRSALRQVKRRLKGLCSALLQGRSPNPGTQVAR